MHYYLFSRNKNLNNTSKRVATTKKMKKSFEHEHLVIESSDEVLIQWFIVWI